MKRLLVSMAAMICIANGVPAQAQQDQSEYIGAYDGSSFETYMAMQVYEDGTFEWILSVGALDMHSKGVWTARDGEIHFTTKPAPVPPEFHFLRFEERTAPTHEILRVQVSGPGGKPFIHADTKIECANGAEIFGFVAGSTADYGDYEPGPCDVPVAVTVMQTIYNVTSPRYDLSAMGWVPGQDMHLEFLPNDIGVYDLTGMRGILKNGILRMDGPLGVVDFRKVTAGQ